LLTYGSKDGTFFSGHANHLGHTSDVTSFSQVDWLIRQIYAINNGYHGTRIARLKELLTYYQQVFTTFYSLKMMHAQSYSAGEVGSK
jgi:hypothetical protein